MIPNERRRILVIDDNDDIHSDFRKTLQRETATGKLAAAASMLFGEAPRGTTGSPTFDVESAMQGEAGFHMAERALAEGKPYAMAFVDMRMPPGWDGVETIQHLWKADPDLQVVICTAYSDYSWEQIIDKLGSTDRLLILKKPFDPIEVCQLATALTEKWKLKHQAALKLSELEAMVHARTAELRHAALTDKLTALPNRDHFEELLRQQVAQNNPEHPAPFAVFFIDFDRFKTINDRLGHKVGDGLLKAIADRLRSRFSLDANTDFRNSPCVAARLGGDEFVILQRNLPPGDAAVAHVTALAEELVALFNTPYSIGEHHIHSTASIGIAISTPDTASAENLLRDADSAMYHAKNGGKDRYALFTPDMLHDALEKLNLEADLRHALDNHQLELVYQPIVCLSDAKLVGFEALLRWNHPTRGRISPLEFIPIAEETGLILPIGRWVLHQTLQQLRHWSDHFPEAADLHMSVNVSARQFTDPHLAAAVTEALHTFHIAPARLNLEVTESVLMPNPPSTHDILNTLHALGVNLHMDDFGTGYSSLNCLHTLPMDVLKIDRSFINNVSERRDYAAVINAIVALAHNLNMKVIAEGVETADQAAMLCALECDEAQGFFFAHPLSAADAEQFMTTRTPLAAAL
jgi:diguanylate cyclase (GGDEF)-like protein